MKELTIEQKAKRYDAAIERAKLLLSDNQLGNAWIYKLLPELKESKENVDERTRKWLIYYFTEVCDNVSEKEKKSVIAWLEKVVTPTPQDWNDYKDKPVVLWNAYVQGVANGMERGKEAVKNHPQDYGLEKQGENHADKVETKFHK